MRRGDRLPDEQAEVVYFDPFIEQLDNFSDSEQIAVVSAVIGLCETRRESTP